MSRRLSQDELAAMLGLIVGLTHEERDALMVMLVKAGWPPAGELLGGERVPATDLAEIERLLYRPGGRS